MKPHRSAAHRRRGDGARGESNRWCRRGHGFNVREVGGAGIALGSAYCDEDGLTLLNGAGQIAGEFDAAVKMFGQQFGQVLLEDGNAAFAEGFYPRFVIVNANDAMADLGKANSGDKAHVPGANYTDGDWF